MTQKDQETWLRHFVHTNFGILLSEEKVFSVASQMQVEAFKSGCNSVPEYFSKNHEESSTHLIDLVNSITVNFSYFYRGEEQMLFLREVFAPDWLKAVRGRHPREGDLRVWSAGCATGEEPYSVAMILDNFIGLGLTDLRVKLLGTDLSRMALAEAQAGIYRTEALKDLPLTLRERYFQSLSEVKVQVVERLKQAILFRTLNLMNDIYPFKNQFDLILCRNVMIYFDEKTNMKVLNNLTRFLNKGGYLLLGQSDPHPKAHAGLESVEPGIYRKVA